MYSSHFQLDEEPFSITPDPAFVYMSARHREALGHLLYGTGRHGGFVQLTGEVGTGKTTIVRTLLAQDLDSVEAAVILNPRQSEHEFLASICDELQVEYDPDASQKVLVDALNARLLESHRAGRRTVLIIDEAQNLNRDVLETVRLLTNLETHKEKLLRIMLVGQPELAELLARDDLRQVAQRITARFHLTSLEAAETREYIAHRLRTAGGNPALFDEAAMARVHALSRGTPRLINILCDRALLGAYAAGAQRVSRELVDRAAEEVFGDGGAARGAKLPAWALPTALAVLIVAVTLAFWPRSPEAPVAAAAPPAAIVTAESEPAVAQPTAEVAPADTDSTGTKDPEPDPTPAVGGLDELLEVLVSNWDAAIPATAPTFCEGAAAAGLRCYRARGDWSLLRTLNRPAILTLAGADGEPEHVLLQSLDGDSATLRTEDGTTENLGTAALDQRWLGDFLLLWRPDSPRALLSQATEGEPVRWLRAKLNRIAGQAVVDADSGAYDEAVIRQVAAFQRSRALDIDGLVGTQTMIALNDADPDWSAPRLVAASGRR